MRRLAFVLALALVPMAAATAHGAAPKASLKVTYWADGPSGASTTWTLRCGPAAGTHPAPRLSCRTLSAHAAQLGPAARACTLMPTRTSARATIKGTWSGRRVNRTYRIGCPGWRDLRVVLTGK
jgi:Subtilisin inhibitor-like